jgi:hypothetical protein
MDQLRAALASRLDPQRLGELALAWSGRVVATAHVGEPAGLQ